MFERSVPYFLAVLLTLICFPIKVTAQKIVSGTVVDAETGETLPSVTLFDFARAEGTITNATGRFELRLSSLPAQIDVRHIGYESQRLEITVETPSELEIRLTPVTYTLEEVVVSGEDPAYNIMRKVIERKAEWRKNLSTYTAESYSRFMLYSDFDLAQVQETIAMNHWKKGEGTRSYVRARRMRPVGAGPMRFASMQNVPNFYDDTIEVLGFDLIGPTHPQATEIYTFTLGGYFEEKGKRIYDIYFSPRSGLSTAFVGHVAVLDSAYVLLKAEMRPSPDNVLPAPIQDWDVMYEQQFAPAGDSIWLPVDLRVEGSVSFGRLGVSYPTARYRQVSRLTRHVINLPVPDSLFQSDGLIVEAPNVDRQDYLFRWNPGLIPMTPKEIEEVVSLDPRMSIARSFRPMGLLAGYTAIDLREEREVVEEEARENLLGGIFSSARIFYDRVDGYFLGAARSVKLSEPITLAVEAGYGLSSELPAYDVFLRYDIGRLNEPSWFFNKAFLRAGTSDIRAPQYASHSYSRLANSVTTYVGWEDYFDYYRRRSNFGELGIRSEKLHTTVSLKYARESHDSIETNRDRKGWFFGHTQRANPAIASGDMSLWTGTLQIGATPETSLKPGGNGLRFTAEHNSGYKTDAPRFTVYALEASLAVPTFFRRRTWSNSLHVRLNGATYTGNLPSHFLHVLDVSRRPISPFGAFKSLGGLPIKGKNVWAVYWEHDFSTSLFEILGLWGVARNGIGFTLHGAHGQALARNSLHRADPFSKYSNGVHHEMGISLSDFFNLPIRLDLTKNFNQKNLTFSLGLVESF